MDWFRSVLRSERKILQQLQGAARDWPPVEREIFEFYFVDGLALTDVARITGCAANAFRAHLEWLQGQLRKEIVKQVVSESKTAVACAA
jgi:DNA-directed RNA polymerase specialized sigma24 family protein